MQFRWVIVDVETTGLNVRYDKIIEIAVCIMTERGIESSWSSLINPGRSIPETIMRLTAITNDMVQDAPSFSEIAVELKGRLECAIFVAHNARFDYGFIKNAFKDVGLDFRTPVLCTLKLLRSLYPGFTRYGLNDLAERFGLVSPHAHRAMRDVETLQALLMHAINHLGLPAVMLSAKKCYSRSSLPSHLKTDIKTIPDSPGVYIFYGNTQNLPLYIGKSIQLRQRIMSHFQSDHLHAKEFALSQQVVRIEIIPTAGELSALLLESTLVKEKMPLYNRKLRRTKTMVGFQLQEREGYLHVERVRAVGEDTDCNSLIGAYKSMAAAQKALLDLIKTHQLCSKLCGLEQSKKACFSYQLKRCLGACLQKEPALDYNQRVQDAFSSLKIAEWPYPGSIVIKEQCEINQMTQYMVFDHWRLIGTCESKEGLEAITSYKGPHDLDAYKVLRYYLTHALKSEQLVVGLK